MSYDPTTARYPSFVAARRGFADGSDSPRAFLERCLAMLAQREPEVHAFVALDLAAARAAADAATHRWQDGAPLSPLDGLPFGVKDCFDVAGFPTRVNSAFFDGAAPATTDAAHVYALRSGGAIPVGKTVTTEFTMAAPGPTWNPWDLSRTPGGSSSGSAAAVAAQMLPLASGSQVRGSVIRPASICGVIGLKPTYGALHRGGGIDPSPSINHLGLLGATLDDVWESAVQIARVVGGDPGCIPLGGPPTMPPAQRPLRVARQYTAGWPETDAASQAIFARWLDTLAARGVEILEPESAPELAAYEEATTAVPQFFFDLMLWELRWPLLAWRTQRPSGFSQTMHGYFDRAEALSVEDYRGTLAARERLRAQHRALAGRVDAFVTLAHIGPGQKGQPAVGTPWYNDASSVIGAPTVNLPLLAVDGVPLGVQLMGFEHRDAELTAHARWFLDAFGVPLVGGGNA